MICGASAPSGSLDNAARWMTASKPVNCSRRHVPQVHPHTRRVRGCGAEHAVGEEAGVQTGYVVSGGLQDRHHDRAQIALMPGDEYSHPHCPFTSRWPYCTQQGASAPLECEVAFSRMKPSACGLRHCTPRSLDRPRNACSSNQSWLVCEG